MEVHFQYSEPWIVYEVQSLVSRLPFLPFPAIELWFLCHPARRLVIIPTELFWLVKLVVGRWRIMFYGSVTRKDLCKTIRFDLPIKLLRLIKMFYVKPILYAYRQTIVYCFFSQCSEARRRFKITAVEIFYTKCNIAQQSRSKRGEIAIKWDTTTYGVRL